MSRKKVIVELTEAEASALWSLANCASDTQEDAMGVLGNAQSVAAGYRALAKLADAEADLH